MRNAALHVLALAFCTLPVACATLAYFPLWQERGEGATVAGGALILLLLAALPVWRAVKACLHSYAVPTVWFISFALFFALSEIAEEMTVISFVGFIGNLIGALLFRAARRKGDERDEG